MREELLQNFRHDHSFGQQVRRPGEQRTMIVIALTATMMAVEIIGGMMFGSMALLADGLHMGSHTVALGINAFAYVYARRHAASDRYSFGTGKVNTLGGYTGAVLLAVFAAIMAWESLWRLVDPVTIAFNQAILVAVVGLLVNGASVLILGVDAGHDHHHHEHHEHHHDHTHSHDQAHGTRHHHDHNLKSAYLHVLADALTSLLAIIALTAGKYTGAVWMDPLMGIVGAILVARWSWGLLRDSSAILLDQQGSAELRQRIHASLESEHTRIVDLHLWAVGPNIYSSMISIVAREPLSPGFYKSRLQDHLSLDHVTIEVHPYQEQ